MPDIQTDLSDEKRAASEDPLSKLHKMSTTAGLGSGDYVAVNVAAVVTALLGVASILAKLNNALLIIPAAAIICGIVALVQISRSNGTQTGKGIAALGLLLSLGLGGWVIAQQVGDYLHVQADTNEIVSLIEDIGAKIKTADFDTAYKLFDDDFHDGVPLEKFKSRLNFFTTAQAKDYYGDLKSMEWNGRLSFDVDSKTSAPVASGVALMTFTKKEDPIRQSIYFRKIASKWKVDAMPELFPPEKPAAKP